MSSADSSGQHIQRWLLEQVAEQEEQHIEQLAEQVAEEQGVLLPLEDLEEEHLEEENLEDLEEEQRQALAEEQLQAWLHQERKTTLACRNWTTQMEAYNKRTEEIRQPIGATKARAAQSPAKAARVTDPDRAGKSDAYRNWTAQIEAYNKRTEKIRQPIGAAKARAAQSPARRYAGTR